MREKVIKWTKGFSGNEFFLILVNHNDGKLQMFNGQSVKNFVNIINIEFKRKKIIYTLKLKNNVSTVSGVIDKKSSLLKYIASDHYISPTLYGLSATIGFTKKEVRRFLIGHFPKLVANLDTIDRDIEEFCVKNYLEKSEVYVTQKSFLYFREDRFYKDINIKISKKRTNEFWNKENIKLTGRAAKVLAVMTNKNSIIVIMIVQK